METASITRQRFERIAGLVLHPLAFVCGLVLLLHGLGRLQQAGWLERGPLVVDENSESDQVYICPMMCVEPTNAPGRCPVCAMELVPAASDAVASDGVSVRIDDETRRLLNIKTAAVIRRPLVHSVQAVGEIGYDETRLRSLAAYVDGRIEALYASYTGVVVQAGQPLAKIYSPKLYAGQVELLAARQAQANRAGDLAANPPLNTGVSGGRPLSALGSSLYDSAYRRLIELGMTTEQIAELENQGQADSRLSLVAPISGTVIEKLKVDGQYVQEGDAIYRLADLTQVWLILQLFPADAAMIQIGQSATTTVQSLPQQTFQGHVDFVSPTVDPRTRTVGVRVVIPNPNGELRVGDFARATIQVPSPTVATMASDPESPPTDPLWIPRDAVLHVGESSVAYVETEPGRFEIRALQIGPSSNGQVVVWEGLQAGEKVATSANFLLDSQMQLTQQPSLINLDQAIPRSKADFEWTEEMLAALEPLSDDQQALVQQQRLCPVGQQPLGSMGTPLPVEVAGQIVYICCEGCRRPLLETPEKYLAQFPQTPSSLDREERK